MSEGEYNNNLSDHSGQEEHETGKPQNAQKDQASVFSDLLKQRSSSTVPVLARRPKLLAAPKEAALERRALAIIRKERKGRLESLRKRPDPLADQALERMLRKVATRGAVHLFNAVHKHQQAKDCNTEKQRNLKKSKTTEKATLPVKAVDNKQVDFMQLLKTGPAKII